MFDTRPTLADMASQIRACRSAEGLTLQQLASRSGVAASTIHKVESQQMVPTVSVLLKIAKGLGTRPEDLIRDNLWETRPTEGGAQGESRDANSAAASSAGVRHAGVWRFMVDQNTTLPVVAIANNQHAMVLVESGLLRVKTRSQELEMRTGDCIELASNEEIQSIESPSGPTRVTLMVAPPGDIEKVLGKPQSAASDAK